MKQCVSGSIEITQFSVWRQLLDYFLYLVHWNVDKITIILEFINYDKDDIDDDEEVEDDDDEFSSRLHCRCFGHLGFEERFESLTQRQSSGPI